MVLKYNPLEYLKIKGQRDKFHDAETDKPTIFVRRSKTKPNLLNGKRYRHHKTSKKVSFITKPQEGRFSSTQTKLLSMQQKESHSGTESILASPRQSILSGKKRLDRSRAAVLTGFAVNCYGFMLHRVSRRLDSSA